MPTLARGEEAKPDPKMEFDPAHAEKMKEGLDLFKANVRQILIKSCVECHGGAEVESGLDLATRKGLMRGGSKGPAVVAGKSRDPVVVAKHDHRVALIDLIVLGRAEEATAG